MKSIFHEHDRVEKSVAIGTSLVATLLCGRGAVSDEA